VKELFNVFMYFGYYSLEFENYQICINFILKTRLENHFKISLKNRLKIKNPAFRLDLIILCCNRIL